MRLSNTIPREVRRLFRLPPTLDRMTRDLDDEIRFHVESRVAALRAAGMLEQAAIAAALREFGDADDLRAYCRTIASRRARQNRVRDWAAEWLQDVRFAARQFARAPGFTATAAVMLALGIGANAAIFSVVNHLLITPLPFAGGNRMVVVRMTSGGGTVLMPAMQSLVDEWRVRAHTVSQIVTVWERSYSLGDSTRGPTEPVDATMISPGALEFVGIAPMLGRGIVPSDTVAGAAPVVLLSEGIWRGRFGGVDMLGKSIVLDQVAHTIVGVMPERFWIPFNADGRQLFTALPGAGARDRQIDAIAKLRSGFTAHDASREIAALFPAKSERNPYADPPQVVRAVDRLPRRLRQTVLVLFGAVVLVLLIACSNVANLVLARALARQREFAIRAAMGAGRARLMRQVFTESLMLAVVGGLLGLGVAAATLGVIRSSHSSAVGQLGTVHIEPAVLLWSLGVTMVASLVFGVAPALLASGARTGASLSSSTRTASGGTAARRFRSGLVVLEVTLAVVLLAGAGLLVRTLVAMQHADVGMDSAGLSGLRLRLNAKSLRDPVARSAAAQAALDQVKQIPGVRAATYAMDIPPRFGIGMGALEIEGRTIDANDTIKAIAMNAVSAEFFALAGIPVRQGRVFAPNPALVGRVDEVVVGEQFARRFWPGGNAIGARVRRDGEPWSTIVGVVGDVHIAAANDRRYDSQMYRAGSLAENQAMLLVRSSLPPAKLEAAMIASVHGANSAIKTGKFESSQAMISQSMDQHRLVLTLLGVFALLALVLAAVGLHGVIAYSVSQRTREIGVRVALGAHASDVARLVLGQGVRLAAIGIVFGIAGALGATRALASLLYGVQPGDPVTVVTVGALMLVVTLTATYTPARRAARLDPVEALRAD
jgi:putative ABC transport system permease protein